MGDLTVQAMKDAVAKLENDAVAAKRAEREARRRARRARHLLSELRAECAALGIELEDTTAESTIGGHSGKQRAGNP